MLDPSALYIRHHFVDDGPSDDSPPQRAMVLHLRHAHGVSGSGGPAR